MSMPRLARLLAALALVPAAAALVSCGTTGDTVLVTVSADDKVEQYDLYVWNLDSARRENVLHTQWKDATAGGKRDLSHGSITIGLTMPQKAHYAIMMVGVTGAVDGDKPAKGAKQFFWADRFTAGGQVEISARLLHVPDGDDRDRDLWPDRDMWPQHVAEAQGLYAGKSDLLDCDDKMDYPAKKVTADMIHPFAKGSCLAMLDFDCTGMIKPCVDSDNDGDPDDTDCAPMDPKVHNPITDPTNPHYDPFPQSANCCGYSLGKTGADANKSFDGDKICHAKDTCGTGKSFDCSGKPIACKADSDCDTFLAADAKTMTSNGNSCMAPANAPPGDDCNDCNPNVHPGAKELCNGIDDNCNGIVDEGCVSCDLDGDGFERNDPANNCPTKEYKASGKPLDCNDEDAGVFPSTTCAGKAIQTAACALREICRSTGPDGKLKDTACNQKPGDGCPTVTCDADGDGYVPAAKQALPECAAWKGTPPDCDDADPHTFPGAPDLCGDGKAQNCVQDNPSCAGDKDGDKYQGADDCDDSDPNSHPWATEKCDGKDNDCDGQVDEGNPDPTGKPMYDLAAKSVLHCNDSNTGECGRKVGNAFTGDCVCSHISTATLYFNNKDQGSRVYCPGETAEIDTGKQADQSAGRCYFAYQPQPQSCDPTNPKDDDCDGRVDAPDGKNAPWLNGSPIADAGKDCWPGALGVCAPNGGGKGSAGKVTGCKMGKSNCYATYGVKPPVNPWFVCDTPQAQCPMDELCNGLDDSCKGSLDPTEQDLDKDGWLACGSTVSQYKTGPATCGSKLAPGIQGCGDCADMPGQTLGVDNATIHPTALEQCDNVDNDCNPMTPDGADDCGKGNKGALPVCCSAQPRPAGGLPTGMCRNTQTDVVNCGSCAMTSQTPTKNGPVCDPLFANQCMGGGCSCGQSGSSCAARSWCSGGSCMACTDDTHCTDACVACTAATPRCISSGDVGSKCVECNADGDCNKLTTKNCVGDKCWCKANVCTTKSVLGVACPSGNHECQTSNCVDGVCCNESAGTCNGCRQCNLGSSLGTCANAQAGSDPHGLCAQQVSVANCKQNTCNGMGNCNVPDNTSCGASSCSGQFVQTDQVCKGGTCTMPMKACSGFGCNGNVCFTTCTSDAQCAPTFYCNAQGACVPQKPTGNSCNLSAGSDCKQGNCRACQSGSCVDGYCCNTACNGACNACSIATGAQANGTCANVVQKPGRPTCAPYICLGQTAGCPVTCAKDEDCTSDYYCAADSTCQQRKKQGDQCNLTAGADCKNGGCRACTTGNCVDGYCCNSSCSGGCDRCDLPNKAGQCTVVAPGDAGQNPSCFPYLCNGSDAACPGTCANDTGCNANYYCSGVACTQKLANGAGCGGDNQCQSGHCVVGQGGTMICGAAGTVDCGLCRVAGSNGQSCVPATMGTDPKSQCAMQSSTCTAGGCNGSGLCTGQIGTNCQGSTCANGASSGGQFTSATLTTHVCGGTAGTCPTATAACPNNLVCANGSSCRTSCGGDGDCLAGFYCNGGACAMRLGNGTSCSANNQCQSAHCVLGQNGTICGVTATASCPKCQVANAQGTACTPATMGSDPKSECPMNNATCTAGGCNGAGTCTGLNGTTCAPTTCVNGPNVNGQVSVATITARTCGGTAGSCPTSPMQCAGNLVCQNGSTCKTGCLADSDCTTGNYCNGGACVGRSDNGTPCVVDNECKSGHCVQGQDTTICGSVTTVSCGLCKVANAGGTVCVNANANSDPKSECTMNLTTCTGANCNGSGACNNVAGMSCAPGSCVNAGDNKGQFNTATTTQHICTTTTNSCPTTTPQCANKLTCNGDTCRTSCMFDAQCVAGNYCSMGGACLPKGGAGASCTGTNQCTPGLVCTGGKCRACGANTDCTVAKAVCTMNACDVCTGNMDCTSSGLGGTCNAGVCVCADDNDCTNSRAPNCNTSTHACACGANSSVVCPNGQVCDGGACKQGPGSPCLTNSDCAAANNCTMGVCT